MSKPIRFFSLLMLLSSSPYVFSDMHYASGLVKGVYWSQVNGGTFTIEGFGSAGTCPINDHLVAIAFPEEDREFVRSVVLSSQIAGKPLNVRVDDTYRTEDGLCYLHVVERVN
ncbi:hypothetical protein [Saccharospirillum sp. MSK14-1]|uniref:hypothetical protein n=1 Tax=Saccharospirillum sp. MSK14-1 TaxID=1897632 RepID=UPI0011B256FE|nr:hypothetical protein [Saccharospirillum sp. MSK14-1]